MNGHKKYDLKCCLDTSCTISDSSEPNHQEEKGTLERHDASTPHLYVRLWLWVLAMSIAWALSNHTVDTLNLVQCPATKFILHISHL